jgi:hypothetical protein
MIEPQKNQPSFNEEMQISNIIHFFKSNLRLIISFTIIGGVLGGINGLLTPHSYNSNVLFTGVNESAIILNTIKDPAIFFSDKTSLECNKLEIINNIEINKITDQTYMLNILHKKEIKIDPCVDSMLDDLMEIQKKTNLTKLENLNEKLKYFKGMLIGNNYSINLYNIISKEIKHELIRNIEHPKKISQTLTKKNNKKSIILYILYGLFLGSSIGSTILLVRTMYMKR